MRLCDSCPVVQTANVLLTKAINFLQLASRESKPRSQGAGQAPQPSAGQGVHL